MSVEGSEETVAAHDEPAFAASPQAVTLDAGSVDLASAATIAASASAPSAPSPGRVDSTLGRTAVFPLVFTVVETIRGALG